MNSTNENRPIQPLPEEDEITLRELILKVQEYAREVRKNWKLVVLITLPFVAFFMVRTFLTPVVYPATLTFMVNEDEGGRSGLSGVLSSFGLSSGGGGKYNMDKIVELARSRRIVQQALFQKISIDGTADYFANHIIRQYNYHKSWKKDESGLSDFLFTTDSVTTFNEVENKALKILHGRIVGDPDNNIDGIFSIAYGKKSNIFTMNTSSLSEELSIGLTEAIYSELGSFYIRTSTEKQLKTYNIARSKADSIVQLLNVRQYSLLKFEDTQKALAFRTAEAPKYQYNRDLQAFSMAYAEAVKNVEFADFALKNATPFFQIVDWPIPPLTVNKSSLLKELLIGVIVGGFIAIAWILGKIILRKTMNPT